MYRPCSEACTRTERDRTRFRGVIRAFLKHQSLARRLFRCHCKGPCLPDLPPVVLLVGPDHPVPPRWCRTLVQSSRVICSVYTTVRFYNLLSRTEHPGDDSGQRLLVQLSSELLQLPESRISYRPSGE